MTLDIPALLARLTLAEKAALTSGSDFWHTQGVERAGVPAVMVTDGPHGLRKQADDAGLDLAGSVPATCFPTAAALASSWDADLLHRVGEALGRETRAERVAVLLGPGVNIKRSPLCGRNFEYFSEDPRLAGVLAAALVRGVQSQGVGASLKHYAVNNQESDRMRVSADLDERTLREIYLPAFERVVRTARPWTIMCAYNRVNGTYVSQHRELLTGILREEWGYDGLVVSDWGAVDDRVLGLAAGLDLEMPASGGETDAEIVAAVESGALDEAVLDLAVTRVLTLLERTLPALAAPGDYDAAAHHALARETAAAGAVLLVNDGLLPLRPVAGETVAVIGEFARTPRYQGAGSSLVRPTRLDDALTALRAGVPDGVEVRFAPGFRLAGAGPGLPPEDDVVADDDALLADAVEAARGASGVLLFLGLPAADETEGRDRAHLDLPAEQVRLLDAVHAVNPRVAVVLSNGGVVTMPWLDRAAAVLECWLTGQAGGGAVADLLLGRVSPSGRLAETIPLRLEDTPAHPNWPGEEGHVHYGERVFVGYRHHDLVGRPVAFPFGHGLSYTSFDYSDLLVRPEPDGSLTVAVTVANTGPVAGREVVQVYVGDLAASVARPRRELAGFASVHLAPGEAQPVTLTVERRALAFWSVRAHAWVVEPGTFEVAVGASSRDLRLRAEVDVEGPGVAVPLSAASTVAECLADPVGGPLLREVLGVGPGDPLPEPLSDPDVWVMLGEVPLRKFARFGMGVTSADLADLLGRVERAEQAERDTAAAEPALR